LVFLAAAAGLRQTLGDLLLGRRPLLAPRREGRGVAGGRPAQVADGGAEATDQHIEDLLQERAVRLLAERLLESRDVPGPGHAVLRLHADEAAQAVVAAELGEHGLGGDVAEGDAQDHDAPEEVDGVVVAPLAAGLAERVEELGIGEGGEQILDGLERGAVFERLPIEQRLGGVEDHHGRGTTRWNEAVEGRYALLRNESPRRWRRGRKIVSAELCRAKFRGKATVSVGRFGRPSRRTHIL